MLFSFFFFVLFQTELESILKRYQRCNSRIDDRYLVRSTSGSIRGRERSRSSETFSKLHEGGPFLIEAANGQRRKHFRLTSLSNNWRALNVVTRAAKRDKILSKFHRDPNRLTAINQSARGSIRFSAPAFVKSLILPVAHPLPRML